MQRIDPAATGLNSRLVHLGGRIAAATKNKGDKEEEETGEAAAERCALQATAVARRTRSSKPGIMQTGMEKQQPIL